MHLFLPIQAISLVQPSMSYMRLLWAIMDNVYPILAHEFEESGTNLKIVRTNLKIVPVLI